MSRLIRPITRRDFCKMLGGSALALAAPASALAADRYWRFGVLADTHIIDEFYDGQEGNDLDSDSIFRTANRLKAARETINAIDPAVEQLFLAGDFIHNYPSPDWDFYFENTTRLDIAKQIIDGFNAPVHVGLGNHDYDIGDISREFTHELFLEKLGIDPYYAVEHRGWKFIHVNNFLGDTMDPTSDVYNRSIGSLGETQMLWLEAELQSGLPTIIFHHFPLPIMQPRERADLDYFALLKQYRETIKLVITGHLHIWLQFTDLFGPPTISCGSTRYDKNSFMVFEVDSHTNTFQVLNWQQIRWGSYNTGDYPLA